MILYKTMVSIISMLIFIACNCMHTKNLIISESVNTASADHTNLNSIRTENPIAKLVFDSTTYHFGKVKKGEKLYREIYFTNKGSADLKIDLISACECTTLDWSRLAIRPGSRSFVRIIYDSKDKEGAQTIDIDVLANTDPPSTFTKFKLYVEK